MVLITGELAKQEYWRSLPSMPTEKGVEFRSFGGILYIGKEPHHINCQPVSLSEPCTQVGASRCVSGFFIYSSVWVWYKTRTWAVIWNQYG